MEGVFPVMLSILDVHIKSLEEVQPVGQLDALKKKFTEQLRQDTHSRLAKLLWNLSLNEYEVFCLSVVLAAEACSDYRELFRGMQQGNVGGITKELVLRLYQAACEMHEKDKLEFLYGEGKLDRYCLEQRADFYLYLDSNIYHFLWYEKIDFKPRIAYGSLITCVRELPSLLIRQAQAEAIKRLLVSGGILLQLIGEEGIGRHFLLRQVLKENGNNCNLFSYDLSAFLEANDTLPPYLPGRLSMFARLSHAVLCIEIQKLPEERKALHILRNFFCRLFDEEKHKPGCVFVITGEDAGSVLRDWPKAISVSFPALSVGEREILWKAFGQEFPVGEESGWEQEAGKYILTPAGIRNVMHTALLQACSEGRKQILQKDLRIALNMRQPPPLGEYASLIDSVFTWEDLILDAHSLTMLHMICNQMNYRRKVGEEWGFFQKMPYGRGISALFYGAPGTGKTMAAQVIANELGLSLYRIDLSQMVSKYIGETEKNISGLFERAGGINAILFFDEADALFARRSDIRDSNDRSANSVTAHLLQKLEDYDGITILATNLLHNMDDAFKRRIKYTVQFQFPAPEIRRQLFRSILPVQAVCDEKLDFDFYADHFELSGSSIREILLNAAFMAAAEQRGICNRHIVSAIRMNHLKYGKIVTDKEFAFLG